MIVTIDTVRRQVAALRESGMPLEDAIRSASHLLGLTEEAVLQALAPQDEALPCG